MPFFKPFALERFFGEYEFEARYLLSSSDCETMSTKELLALEEGAEERYLDLRLGYTEARGEPSLRADLAALYKGLGPDDILVHAGAEEAILCAFLALLSPGDRVVVNHPCYQSLSEIPRAIGCEVLPWSLREEGGRWAFDLDALASLLERGIRLVVLNAPHNPTGALPTPEEYGEIIRLCRRSGALLFSDEVYRGLELDPDRRLEPACEAYEEGISLGVMSKGPGLAGLRIGWLASRKRGLLESISAQKDYGTICSSGPSEFLAGIAARRMEELLGRSRAIVAANLRVLSSFFERRPDFASWSPPEGGSIGFPSLSGGADAEALARKLVAEAGVMLLPGSCYDYRPSSFRLGFGRANMPEALSALEEWLDRSTR